MPNEEQSPTGGVTPHLMIRDGKAKDAIDFYQRAFGAEELMRHATDDGRLMHAHLKINGGSLMMHDDFREHSGPAREPAGTILHLQVDDADKWWNRAVDPARRCASRSTTSSGATATASSRTRSATPGPSARR